MCIVQRRAHHGLELEVESFCYVMQRRCVTGVSCSDKEIVTVCFRYMHCVMDLDLSVLLSLHILV